MAVPGIEEYACALVWRVGAKCLADARVNPLDVHQEEQVVGALSDKLEQYVKYIW